MGDNTISTITDGTTANSSNVNQYKTALDGDLLPRSAGATTTLAGSLGSVSKAWLMAYVESGYWNAGDIKAHHSYNGVIGPGQGWFLCDGTIINEANYESQSWASVGDWAKFIGTSVLDGKYSLPLTDKYMIGTADTTQTGTGALTSTGVAGSEIDFEHNHQYYNETGGDVDSQVYDINGDAISIPFIAKTVTADRNVLPTKVAPVITSGAVQRASNWTDNKLSATQDIRPESIEVQYFIRII